MTDFSFESTRRELSTDKGVLRYHEAGDGRPLVLLHGSGPGVTGWRNFSENLPVFARHHRTFILEFPGFGVSDDSGEHPMMGAPGSVVRFLDGLGIDKAHVIGNSMGGRVATQFALANPDRIDRLVTIGGVGRSLFNPTPGEGLRLLVEFAENPSRDRLVQWLESMVYDPAILTEELIEQRWELASDPDVLESTRRIFSKASMRAIVNESANADGALWSLGHKITAPTLLTWGRDDRVTPLDSALIPMRTIPQAQLHVFPNCGHWVQVEAKAAWESTVLAFLSQS